MSEIPGRADMLCPKSIVSLVPEADVGRRVGDKLCVRGRSVGLNDLSVDADEA